MCLAITICTDSLAWCDKRNLMTNSAWSITHAKLHTFLHRRILLPKNSRILIAVSGGQDSLCLAQLLADLQRQWQWSLAIAHCDHRWRPDSADNAAYVETLAEHWQIPCWIEVAQNSIDSEAAARAWRYETFAKLARQHEYTHVVTGHTRSDRAETVLYNLIRGTGLDGLGTLSWERSLDGHHPSISLVRPLLNVSREETGQFCQQQNIRPWEDSSNQQLTFRRNRIRLELLPYLQEHFNPQVERAIAQMAETVKMDMQYIEEQAQALYTQSVTEGVHSNHSISAQNKPDKGRYWEVSQSVLQSAPAALQNRVIRQLLQKALAKSPTFREVEKLAALIHAPNRTKSDPFTGGLIAEVRKPIVVLSSPSSNRPPVK